MQQVLVRVFFSSLVKVSAEIRFRMHRVVHLRLFVLQVQQSQEKIARLEQEKEHWLLEAQLGRVRLEKENQRIAELEARLSSALGDALAGPTHSEAVSAGPGEPEKDEKTSVEHQSHCTSLVRTNQCIRPNIIAGNL